MLLCNIFACCSHSCCVLPGFDLLPLCCLLYVWVFGSFQNGVKFLHRAFLLIAISVFGFGCYTSAIRRCSCHGDVSVHRSEAIRTRVTNHVEFLHCRRRERRKRQFTLIFVDLLACSTKLAISNPGVNRGEVGDTPESMGRLESYGVHSEMQQNDCRIV